MANGPNDSLGIEYGSARFGARGMGVMFLIGVFAIIVSNFYVDWRAEQQRDMLVRAIREDHRLLALAIDMHACITTYDFAERMYLRKRLEKIESKAHAFQVLSAWCPWLQ